jgi:cystathionine beta-lyase/cystathionine gamma-synthase
VAPDGLKAPELRLLSSLEEEARMSTAFRDIETQLVHSGERVVDGAVCLPVFQSATFLLEGDRAYHDVRYARLSNTPNHDVLHAKLAAIEGGEAALVTASGMAAITTSLLSFLRSGDHLLVQDCLYGGTHGFVTHELPELGIAYDFIDGDDERSWPRLLRPTTRAVYVESMTNPLLGVADLPAVVRFARAHGLVTMIDNTFASPVNFRPLEVGFDLSLHSATKYLNGHDDIAAGCVIGRGEHVERIRLRLSHLGGSLDAHACFLLNRGLVTLALRVRQQNATALRLARFLEGHPAVERVIYPGLESHPRHARARELFRGYGGVLGFEVRGGEAEAASTLERLRIALVAPSLGGVHTLVMRPARVSHAGLTAEERARLGIGDRLIRVSVGIESAEEVCADFAQALGGD